MRSIRSSLESTAWASGSNTTASVVNIARKVSFVPAASAATCASTSSRARSSGSLPSSTIAAAAEPTAEPEPEPLSTAEPEPLAAVPEPLATAEPDPTSEPAFLPPHATIPTSATTSQMLLMRRHVVTSQERSPVACDSARRPGTRDRPFFGVARTARTRPTRLRSPPMEHDKHAGSFVEVEATARTPATTTALEVVDNAQHAEQAARERTVATEPGR